MELIRTRWAAVGAALAITLGAGGIGLVSATSPSEAATFVPITACRVMDTRPDSNVGPKASPLGPTEIHTVVTHGDNGECTGIPGNAVAVSMNVTAVGATAPTFLTIWASGELQPGASSLNPTPGQPPTPNAVTTNVNGDGEFDIFNLAGSVHVLADINGYYVDHDHDDRYYSKEQLDASFGRGVSVGNGEGVGSTICTVSGIEMMVRNARGELVDSRFSFIVPGYASGQIRGGGSIRSSTPNLTSVEHPAPGLYCLVFTGTQPTQTEKESTVASVTADN